MSKVIPFTGITKLDLDPSVVLQHYVEKDELEGFVICGYTKDGDTFFASTYADGGTALWLLEKCKVALLGSGDEK